LVLVIVAGWLVLAAPADAVRGDVWLEAQKVGSPTRFRLVAFPKVEKRPVALTVAFPRGTVFVKRGASCTTVEPFGGCPKQSRLGYGVADWTVGAGGLECLGNAGVRFWNAAEWRGFVVRDNPGPCFPEVYYGARFKKNVLTIAFFDHTEGGPPGAEATLRQFALNAHKTAGASVPPLRTPRSCNRERGWKTVVTVRFEDGSKERFSTKHRCHG
jgi:hypothetical protein